MGYHVTTVTPANMAPSAQAELPSMMILPRRVHALDAVGVGLGEGGGGVIETCLARAQFMSAALALRLPNCFTSAAWTCSISMESNCASTPS